MESLTPPETRGRSRSKTPFLRSSCDRESCTNLDDDEHVHDRKKSPYKKTPTVKTIIEEVVEHSTPSRNMQVSQQKTSKVITSDYSSEDTSPETARARQAVASVHTSSFVTRTQTFSSTLGSNNFGNRSTAGKNSSFSMQQSGHLSGSAVKPKEVSQNELNSAFEQSQTIKTSTPISMTTAKKIVYSTSPTNGDLSGHIAYKEYKEAGEYWKKYPKTDYTYSKLSPHRRELAPGIVAMPNMSRKSLEQHQERVNYMIQQNPAQEMYIRKRYATTTTTHRQMNEDFAQSRGMGYDSQDETDFVEYQDYKKSRLHMLSNPSSYTYNSSSWVTRSVTRIVTLFTSFLGLFWYFEEDNMYRTRIEERRGIFGRIRSAISSAFLSLFRRIYTFISWVLYLDTWLLRSSSPDNRNKKRFLLFMVLLLPLLLLAAWSLLEEEQREAIILRYQKAIPISMLGFRSILPTNWRNLFSFNLGLMSQPSSGSAVHQGAYSSVINNIQKSLSPEEYDNVINHINDYVKKLVDDKLSAERQKGFEGESKISKEMSVLIASAVKENLLAAGIADSARIPGVQLELNDAEIEKIASVIRTKLLMDGGGAPAGKFALSQDNLEEISKLIKQGVEANSRSINFLERVDVNDIIFKILGSPKMEQFVDSRILKASQEDIISRQKAMIDELNSEIALIKLQFATNLKEQQNFQSTIDFLKAGQDEILVKMQSNERSNNARFNDLIALIDSKLASLNEQQFASINNQVRLYLLEILGYKGGQKIDDIDLQNWIRNTFVAKELLEEKLKALHIQVNADIKAESDHAGAIIIKEIGEKLKSEILSIVESRHLELQNKNGKAEISLQDVKKLVRDALTVYDADKTGLVDYALESAGGQVLSTRCTENYQTKSAQISVFGIPLWYPSNTPRIAISPAVQPGECWAFQGFPGFLVVKLNSMIFVSGFTLEHIPKSLSPNGKIDSAPKNFSVWGLTSENDQDPVLFGEYEYKENGTALQYFPVQKKDIKRPYEMVELRVETNHGNVAYTCLYRFRVHGLPST